MSPRHTHSTTRAAGCPQAGTRAAGASEANRVPPKRGAAPAAAPPARPAAARLWACLPYTISLTRQAVARLLDRRGTGVVSSALGRAHTAALALGYGRFHEVAFTLNQNTIRGDTVARYITGERYQMGHDLTGAEILGYQVVSLIAEGGMGSVWRAENRAIDKVVAIKVLKPELAGNTEVRERFRIEAMVQVKLGHHPYIVKVEQFDAGLPAMVMDYIEGRTLQHLIHQEVGKIPHERALPWIQQLLSALEFAHGQSEPVIHRDIKPSNIIIASRDNTARLMDFGIAKVAQTIDLTGTGATLGTSAYMAPEQFTGASKVEERADIYALGATMFEMLAGRPPFVVDGKGDSRVKLAMAHMQQPPPDPRDFYEHIPAWLAGVVLRCLEKEPANRYRNVGELRAALSGGTGGAAAPVVEQGAAATVVEPGTGRAPAPSVPLTPSELRVAGRRRSPLLWVGLAAGVLAVVVVVAISLSQGRPVNPPAASGSPGITKESQAVKVPPPPQFVIEVKRESPKAGIKWVQIPGGSFQMMKPAGFAAPTPSHRVHVSNFYMGKTEVTNAQYSKCVRADACGATGGDSSGETHPVAVSWRNAVKFCRWAGGRLPSEAEWEYAARSGGKWQLYPWGDEHPGCEHAVWSPSRKCAESAAPVCSKPTGNSAQGLCDLAGNAWEWVQDCYHDNYSGAPTDGSPWITDCGHSRRVIRGGGAGTSDLEPYLRAHYRDSHVPSVARHFNGGPIGFRCARKEAEAARQRARKRREATKTRRIRQAIPGWKNCFDQCCGRSGARKTRNGSNEIGGIIWNNYICCRCGDCTLEECDVRQTDDNNDGRISTACNLHCKNKRPDVASM